MKLLVNVTPLTPPLTGIGHYTRQLLIQLLMNPEFSQEIEDIKGFDVLRVYNREELTQLLGMVSGVDSGHSDSAETTTGTEIKQSLLYTLLQCLKPYIKKIPYARVLKNKLMQRSSGLLLDRYQDYIYWEPNYVMQAFEGKSLATIYDLSHIHYPEYHPKERVAELNKGLELTLAQADRLVSISQFSQQQILEQWSPDQSVDLVFPAVDASFYQIDDAQCIAVKQKYQLPEHYVLSVATLEPRKNFVGLIQAYAELPDSLRQDFPLVLAGTRGWLTDDLERVLAPLVERGEVRYLGYVAQADMPALYQGAELMAYVSFYEGYGMPIAESMAAGTAVVTSDCTSMPEVAGGCAELVDPRSQSSIRDGLYRMLTDENARQRRAEEGRQRALNWSWQQSASRLMSSFRALSN